MLKVIFIFSLFFPTALFADFAGRVDSHAPIGVMADHTHKQDELMVSFRHNTELDANMIGFMYSPDDSYTLMLMSASNDRGMGLTAASVLVPVYEEHQHRAHIQLGTRRAAGNNTFTKSLTYSGHNERIGWGAQISNDDDFTVWASYSFLLDMSASVRTKNNGDMFAGINKQRGAWRLSAELNDHGEAVVGIQVLR